MPIFIKNKNSNTYDVAIVASEKLLVLDTNINLEANSEIISEIISEAVINTANN